MRVLWLFAHPEARSFNGALRDIGIDELRRRGHEVRQSDLYAMGWKAVLDRSDVAVEPDSRFIVGDAQRSGYEAGTLAADVRAQQRDVEWAEALIVQFPLWWYGMPAILKGWFDRVFTQGFAFGLPDRDTGRSRQYGDGGLVGKRALTIVSYGAREEGMGPRGIHGDINDILFPLQHGILWYTGTAPLEPFAVGGTHHPVSADFTLTAKRLRARLSELGIEDPIPFRHKKSDDYDANLVLRDHIAPGRTDLNVHRADG